MHGGSAPQVKAKAEHRAAVMAAHAEAERMVARAGVQADPIDHLLESLYRAAALVEVWGGMVADLDNAGEVAAADEPGRIRGWAERRLAMVEDGSTRMVVDHDPLLVRQSDKKVALHPYVVEYQSALERRAKFAKLAIDAGIAERQVRLAERQGELIAQVIRGVLADLGVDDREDVPQIVRRHLSLVSGGN